MNLTYRKLFIGNNLFYYLIITKSYLNYKTKLKTSQKQKKTRQRQITDTQSQRERSETVYVYRANEIASNSF
jgi:hypothetical protein